MLALRVVGLLRSPTSTKTAFLLARFHSRGSPSSMYSFHLSVLSLSTNLLKHPASSHKAAPTVSISNTYAERDTSPQNYIPFPSAPISCPAPSSSHSDLEIHTDGPWEVVCSPVSDPWHLSIHRRRPQSCLATSFVHRDNHAMPSSSHEPSKAASVLNVSLPMRKRKLAAKRVRVPSASAKQPVVAKRKSRRSAKRQAADLQLTATLHRSLASNLRSTPSRHAGSSSEDALVLRQQDRILVERLWHNLVDQGLKPVPLAVPSELDCPLPHDDDPFALDPARVDHVFQSEPIYEEPTLSPVCGGAASGLPTPPPSPQRSAPIRVPAPRYDPHSLPTPPATPSQPAGADVMPIPQLVASLILRHRDRSATRARSGSACSAGVRADRGRSPLRKSVVASLAA